MWIPRLPVVFGYDAIPSSSRSRADFGGRFLHHRERDPGSRVEVDPELVGQTRRSAARDGHTWNPRQPRLTAHATCATSADHHRPRLGAVRRRDRRRLEPGRRVLRDALLEERVTARAPREPLQHHRPAAHRREQRLPDRLVVADEVELGLAPRGEEHACRGGETVSSCPSIVERDLVRHSDRRYPPVTKGPGPRRPAGAR